jgi:hypothetical protein
MEVARVRKKRFQVLAITLVIAISLMSSASAFALTADLHKDGIVNFADFAVLAGEWLQGVEPNNPVIQRGVNPQTWIDGPGLQEYNQGAWYFAADYAVRSRDTNWPIIADGPLLKIRINYVTWNTSIGAFRVSCYRGGTNVRPAERVWETNHITPIFANSPQSVYEIDLSSLSLYVQPGDQLAFMPIAAPGKNLGGDRFRPNTGGSVFYDNGTGDGTGADWTEKPGNALQWEAEISTPKRIVVQANNVADGAVIRVPAMLDKPYYVVAQDVNVADGGTVTFAFQRRSYAATSGYDTVETVTLDLSTFFQQEIIANGRSVDTSNAASQYIDLAMWFDIVTRRWNVLWSNKGFCEGGARNIYGISNRDLTWRSHAAAYTNRRAYPYAWGIDPIGDFIKVLSNNPLNIYIYRSPRKVTVNTTGTVSIGSVAVCCEPIIMLGDSYSSTNAIPTGVSLDGSGRALKEENYLTYKRVILLAAIGGNKITAGDSLKHSISARYGMVYPQDKDAPPDSPDVSVIGRHDACEFVNAIYFLPNGPSVNDIMQVVEPAYDSGGADAALAAGATLTNTMLARIAAVVGDICSGDYSVNWNYTNYTLKGRSNKAVLCEMCWRQLNGVEKEQVVNDVIASFNQRLRQMGNILSLPVACTADILGSRTVSGFDPQMGQMYYGGFFDAYRENYNAPFGQPPNSYHDVHPSYNPGYKKIAEIMADAYEHQQ